MGRYMAMDYGTKRVGIAVTDPLRIIANGLDTFHPKDILPFLRKYMETEVLDLLIIGKPVQMDNTPSEITAELEAFIRKLKKELPSLRIVRMDERFTSKMANRTLLEAGLKKKDRQNKEMVDKISATILLQSYMERESY